MSVAMSRRSWLNPNGPTGKPLGLVNPLNAPETGKEIWLHEIPLPLGTMSRFMEFLSTHRLPNGQLTTLPTLSSQDIATKFAKPYNDWAPAPYNNNPMRGDAAVTRFSICFTGLPDLVNIESLFSGGGFDLPSKIDFELEICRQRLWAGMVPLSDRRWADKKLDSLENIDLAVEYLLKACDMVHFSMPATSRKTRQAYNKAHDIFTHFDTVLAAYYTANPTIPRPSPLPSLANLWADFFFTHIHTITTRLHAWAATHVDRLTSNLAHALQTTPIPPNSTTYTPQQHALLTQFENLAPITRRLDHTTLIPLTGFRTTLPHWRSASSPPIVDWVGYIRARGATPLNGAYPADIQQRDEVYHERVACLMREELTRLRAAGGRGVFSTEAVARPVGSAMLAYRRGRRDLRGEVAEEVQGEGGEEVWVGSLRGLLEGWRGGGEAGAAATAAAARPPVYTSWGFVAYRVWYDGGEGEWARFLERFEEDVVEKWGEGVKGAEGIREKMEIRWVDGREVGIAEGDVEGARRHFKGLSENNGAGLHGLNAPAFLVADKSSVESYTHGTAMPGQTLVDEVDLGPFILVGQSETGDRSVSQALGFDGTVRVLGSVLLDDVWPCLWWRLVNLENMWNLAAWHPSGVYVGSVVQSQVEGWEKLRAIQDDLLKKADQWKREGKLD